MDNLTHSLIGIAVARSFGRREPGLDRALLWTAVLASNAPDLDFVLRPLLGGGKLSYLLHHRGFTHTFACIPLLAWASAYVGKKIACFQTRSQGSQDGLLIAAGAVAVLLHIFADFWNDYGVHPVWPLSNRWFYGDMIFIVEPALWLGLLPLAYFEARTRWARVAWAGVGLGILALGWGIHWIPPILLGALAFWGAAWVFAQKKWPGARTAALAVGIALAVFAVGSRVAKTRIRATMGAFQERQLGVTPAPGNPFCWKIVSAHDEGGDYVARLGVVSLLPTVFTPRDCYKRVWVARTAPLATIVSPHPNSLEWLGEFRRPLSELRALREKSPSFAAFLKFARVPFWTRLADGREVAGDLRYDFEPELGFAEIEVGAETLVHTGNLPPWVEPLHPVP